MSPSTQVESRPETEVLEAPQVESFREEIRIPIVALPATAVAPRNRFPEGSFQSSMIELNRMNSGSKLFDILISLTMNLAVLAAPILAGLYFTDTLNMRQFESTFLVAPPPPPPPPPAPAVVTAKAAPSRRVFEHAGKLLAPTAIPRNVAEIKEAPLPSDADGADGILGGVPGGVPGGTMGGVLGGVIGGSGRVAAPPAPKESKPHAPVHIGGRVRAPRQIQRVEPKYPSLARQTHLSGTVIIEAVLDESGNVVEMKVVSGHPLLLQAALDAVRQWKYEPTYLNDIPVAVQMNISVTFTLSQ